MRAEIGGVVYDDEAKLIPGAAPAEDPPREPEIEILFRLTEKSTPGEPGEEAVEDLQAAEKEARHIALHLRQLMADGFPVLDRDTKQPRAVEWRDMAVLLRAPSTKAEGYAKQFERAGVPLDVARGGFYASLEVADLLNLLRLLDIRCRTCRCSRCSGRRSSACRSMNWRRSGWRRRDILDGARPLCGSPESRVQSPEFRVRSDLASRITHHASRFPIPFALLALAHARPQGSLSTCLDSILVETHYAEWLRAQDRGAQRHANVQRLLGLAEQFDQFQRQGLFRFLRFIEAQQARARNRKWPRAPPETLFV